MPFIGTQPEVGGYSVLDALTASATANYTLQLNSANFTPNTANSLLVSLNGVIQKPGSSFTVSGSTLSFSSALTSSDSIDFIIAMGEPLLIGTPSDSTVTTSKIATNAVSTVKIADDAVTGAKIENNPTIAGNLTVSGNFTSQGIDDNADATAMTIDSSERVMIGTTTEGNASADELTVAGTGNSGITIRSGTSNSGAVYFSDGTSGADEYAGYLNYSHGINSMTLGVSGVTALQIYATGAVTKVLQPAFYIETSATQTDFGLSSTHIIAFGTERFDQNNDVASNTFTAPVTGRYFLHTTLRLESIDTAASYYLWGISTSNHNYLGIIDPNFSSDLGYISVQQTVLADMDAGDTSHVILQQAGGTQQTDLQGAGGYSYFCGNLVC